MWFLMYLPLKLAQVSNCAPGNSCDPNSQTNFPEVTASADTIKTGLQIFFGIIAAVTVIYIIINAIRYATSLGDPKANEQLRNSIIYAAIGLSVVLSAEAVVTFVLGRL